MRPTLFVMLKVPRPGRVKTRLGRDIGMTAAAWWFRHQTARLLRELRDPRWRLVLAVSPDREGGASRAWPAGLMRVAQGGGDLGVRMARLLRGAKGPVCIIGADIPGLRRGHVAHAFAALRGHDLVFGPATDGGFWLVGARHGSAVPAGVFANVRWSGEHALSDSLASAATARIALVQSLHDVDCAADLGLPADP